MSKLVRGRLRPPCGRTSLFFETTGHRSWNGSKAREGDPSWRCARTWRWRKLIAGAARLRTETVPETMLPAPPEMRH